MTTLNARQSGFSSILFAMIFAIILSLLAVGFATLVRNDQRQTIDQTLNYQAQYAAETAINLVAAGVKDTSSPLPKTQPVCQNFDVKVGSDVTVPCVVWNDKPSSILFNTIGKSPLSARIEPGAPYTTLSITYSSDQQGTYASPAFPASINGNNYPVLRISLINANGTGFRQYYIVPMGDIASNGDYPNPADGSVYAAECLSGTCTANSAGLAGFNGYIAIAALGSEAKSVAVRGLNGATPVELLNAQYEIDATAIAQDVTKRVQARIPMNPQTWRPGYVSAAANICKDIRVDGTNNNGVSGDNTCANLLNAP